MNLDTLLVDTYDRRARLRPALLVVLPIALTVLVWSPVLREVWVLAVSLLVGMGVTYLLAQVARARGKRLQDQLYESWGGKPTTVMLRHRDQQLSADVKARYRVHLARKLGRPLPSLEDELADASAADTAYDGCASWLREQTRDRTKFAILFHENTSYGFRRNLWALKPYALGTAAACFLASAGLMVRAALKHHVPPGPEVVGGTALVGAFFVLLSVVVTRSWVKQAADSYAAQLLAACDAPEDAPPARGR